MAVKEGDQDEKDVEEEEWINKIKKHYTHVDAEEVAPRSTRLKSRQNIISSTGPSRGSDAVRL